MNNVELALDILGIWYRHREDLYMRVNIANYDSTKQIYIQAALKFKVLGLVNHDRILVKYDK